MNRKVPPQIRKLMQELKAGLLRIYGEQLKGVYLLTDYKNYWQEHRRSSQLASDLSLEYEVTISRLLVKESQWQESMMPVIRNIHQDGIPA
ncbi:MAG: hypothetical protein ACOYYJ_11965 [Chloroflexota bacterium]